MLPLFGTSLGTIDPRYRTTNYRRIHDDLRLQYRKDNLRRAKTKRERHIERSNFIKQQGDTP